MESHHLVSGLSSAPADSRGARGLRLVRLDGSVTLDQAARAADVARENALAAQAARTLDPADARRIMLRRIALSIEGGRNGLVRPEVRRRLVHTADTLGIRAFDANLLIAVAQDRCRRGEDPVGIDVLATASVLEHPSATRARLRAQRAAMIRTALASAAVAGLIVTLLIEWLLRG